jgi:hypothetical protein
MYALYDLQLKVVGSDSIAYKLLRLVNGSVLCMYVYVCASKNRRETIITGSFYTKN